MSNVCLGLTLVPGSWRVVQTVWQVGSVRKHPGLARGWLPKRPHPTGARSGELSGEVHREGPQATVGVLQGVRTAPARLLLNEGVVGGQGAVRRPRMEVQKLRPLAAPDRHPAASAGTRYGLHGWRRALGQEGQVPEVGPHSPHGPARLSQHGGRRLTVVRRGRKGPVRMIPNDWLLVKVHSTLVGASVHKYRMRITELPKNLEWNPPETCVR